MSEGFTFISSVVGHEKEALAGACLAAGMLTVSGVAAAASLKRAKNPLTPEARLTLRNMFDLFSEFIIELSDRTMGKENRKYIPFVATIFIYILCMNFMGLLPGFSQPTSNITINLGIALVVFTVYNYWGIRENGLIKYLQHFCGPFSVFSPWAVLAIFLFVLEMFSNFIRPFTLSLRLFGNMTADHAVLSAFTDLTKIGVPVIFYVLGTVISSIQAFVFSLLTMVYIKLAIGDHSSEHGSEEGHHH